MVNLMSDYIVMFYKSGSGRYMCSKKATKNSDAWRLGCENDYADYVDRSPYAQNQEYVLIQNKEFDGCELLGYDSYYENYEVKFAVHNGLDIIARLKPDTLASIMTDQTSKIEKNKIKAKLTFRGRGGSVYLEKVS